MGAIAMREISALWCICTLLSIAAHAEVEMLDSEAENLAYASPQAELNIPPAAEESAATITAYTAYMKASEVAQAAKDAEADANLRAGIRSTPAATLAPANVRIAAAQAKRKANAAVSGVHAAQMQMMKAEQMMKKATAAAHQSELGAAQAESAGATDMTKLVQTASAQAEEHETVVLQKLQAEKKKEDQKRQEKMEKEISDIDEKKRLLAAETKKQIEDGQAALDRMKKKGIVNAKDAVVKKMDSWMQKLEKEDAKQRSIIKAKDKMVTKAEGVLAKAQAKAAKHADAAAKAAAANAVELKEGNQMKMDEEAFDSALGELNKLNHPEKAASHQDTFDSNLSGKLKTLADSQVSMAKQIKQLQNPAE